MTLGLALKEDTPAFTGDDVYASSPSTSSPYVITDSKLRALLGVNPGRRHLADRLLTAKIELSRHCLVHAILLGGSFVRLSKSAPKDCDGVVFYSLRESSDPDEAISGIETTVNTLKSQGLDLRVVPVDGDPLVTIKAACYFSLLYSADRFDREVKHGSLLLIDD